MKQPLADHVRDLLTFGIPGTSTQYLQGEGRAQERAQLRDKEKLERHDIEPPVRYAAKQERRDAS